MRLGAAAVNQLLGLPALFFSPASCIKFAWARLTILNVRIASISPASLADSRAGAIVKCAPSSAAIAGSSTIPGTVCGIAPMPKVESPANFPTCFYPKFPHSSCAMAKRLRGSGKNFPRLVRSIPSIRWSFGMTQAAARAAVSFWKKMFSPTARGIEATRHRSSWSSHRSKCLSPRGGFSVS